MEPELSRGLIDCYFSGRNGQHLVKHQIDSFNDFISRKLEQIIEGFNLIDVCNTYLPAGSAAGNNAAGCYKYIVSISMQNPTLSRPLIYEKDGSTKAMLPNDARVRNLTSAAPLSVDICITAKTWSAEARAYVTDTKRLNAVNLGRVPVMVRSRYCALSHANQVPNGMDECRHDYGGYFVINGSEKVVISQDRIAENRTYVFLNTKASCYSHVAEIRSVQEDRFGVPKTLTLKLSSKANNFGRTVKLCMHHIKHDVPVVIMFRALGVESDRDIVRYIVQDEVTFSLSNVTRWGRPPPRGAASQQDPFESKSLTKMPWYSLMNPQHSMNLPGDAMNSHGMPISPSGKCMEAHGDVYLSPSQGRVAHVGRLSRGRVAASPKGDSRCAPGLHRMTRSRRCSRPSWSAAWTRAAASARSRPLRSTSRRT